MAIAVVGIIPVVQVAPPPLVTHLHAQVAVLIILVTVALLFVFFSASVSFPFPGGGIIHIIGRLTCFVSGGTSGQEGEGNWQK